MKTPILWVVMLAVICLCTVSACADTLIDSFNYSSNVSLQAVWGGSAATMATVGGVPCMDTYSSNTGSSYGVVEVTETGFSLNLTGLTGVTLSMAGTNTSQVYYGYIDLYMDNGPSYWRFINYNYNFFNSSPNTLTSDELQAGFCPLAWAELHGTSNLANVTKIVVGYFTKPNSGPGDVYMSNLIVNGVAQAATPVISPDGPDYATTVSITCGTPNATIMYTTDGSTPTLTNGTVVPASGILVNQACTVKAVAFATGYTPSTIAQASFTTHNNMLIDSFDYSSNAALQAVWGGSPATMATVGGVPCMDTYSSNTSLDYGHVAVAKLNCSLNLTGLSGVTLSMAGTNPSQVYYSYVTLYMDNGSSLWSIPNYNYNFFNIPTTLTTNKLQAGFCPLAWGTLTGTSDLANVTSIYVGYFTNPNSGPGDVYVSNLIAVGPTPSLNVDVTLQDFYADLSLHPIRVDLLQNGNVARTTTVWPTTNPTRVIFANVSDGNYTVRASAAKFLSGATTVSVAGGTAAQASVSLVNGDVDGDGTVTSTDLSIVSD